jgi:hypothetical protein
MEAFYKFGKYCWNGNKRQIKLTPNVLIYLAISLQFNSSEICFRQLGKNNFLQFRFSLNFKWHSDPIIHNTGQNKPHSININKLRTNFN